jgi:putative oxidoreductase
MLNLFRLVVHQMYLYQYSLHQFIRDTGPNTVPVTKEMSVKTTSTIARYLLGLIFLTFGLNGFLHFIPMPPPTGVAAQFFGALFVSRFYVVIFLLQIVPAVLLLANRYVPLALTILGAVIVNILCFHIFMAPAGLPLAVVVTVLWFLTTWSVRSAFAGILQR